MNNAEQLFLNELDNKFWKAADKLVARQYGCRQLQACGAGANLPEVCF